MAKLADFGSARTVELKDCKNQGTKRLTRYSELHLLSSDSLESSKEDSVEHCDGLINESEPLLTWFSSMSEYVGTLLWEAPEMLTGRRYGAPVDVYR